MIITKVVVTRDIHHSILHRKTNPFHKLSIDEDACALFI